MPEQVISQADYFQELHRLGDAFSDAGIPITPPWSRMMLGIGTQALVSRGIPEAVYRQCVDVILGMPLTGPASDEVSASLISTDEPDNPIPYYDRITAALRAARYEWTEADTATRLIHVGITGLRRYLPEHTVRQATASAFAMAQVRRELMANGADKAEWAS